MVMVLLFVAVVVITLMITLHRRERRNGLVGGRGYQPGSQPPSLANYHGGLDGGGGAAGAGGCDGGSASC